MTRLNILDWYIFVCTELTLNVIVSGKFVAEGHVFPVLKQNLGAKITEKNIANVETVVTRWLTT